MKTRHIKPSETGGFTLVELMVVLAIVAILMGLAVPAARMFVQGDQERGARELYTLLRAARVYAATYRINTAVAYEVRSDVLDTFYGAQAVQVLRGAMMVYELPTERQAYAGFYVPVPGWGDFRPFPTGYCVLLQEAPEGFDAPPGSAPGGTVIDINQPDKPMKFVDPASLGLIPVKVLNDSVEIEGTANQHLWQIPPGRDQYTYYPAHRFDQTGKLIPPTGDTSKERYRIFFAPMPDRPQPERLTSLGDANPEDPLVLKAWIEGTLPNAFTMVGVSIEIYRSTGRVEMGKL